MSFPILTNQDFDIFTVPGLDERMSLIRSTIQPKLKEIGDVMSHFLTDISGLEMTAHVAKHARRTVNPPDETWVAWAANARGYKAHPHFQVGMWSTHLFVWFALFSEAVAYKPHFSKEWTKKGSGIFSHIPPHFVWSFDHTRPDAVSQRDITIDELSGRIHRLETTKSAEILCGIHLQKTDSILQDAEELQAAVKTTLQTLLPLYRLAF